MSDLPIQSRNAGCRYSVLAILGGVLTRQNVLLHDERGDYVSMLRDLLLCWQERSMGRRMARS